MRQRTTSTKFKHRSSVYAARQSADSIHWLFRTNIPRRRNQSFSSNIHKRNFFGMGDIIGVLTNPAETVRSLTESKQLLEDARREIRENNERSQLRPKHTFSRLPGFLPRHAETQAIERTLEGEPSFTVLFGASSVGKTALLREVLTREKYHVLHFDLRIPGFADLSSLYMSLSQQMEQYFRDIGRQLPGYEDFEKESWSFKHDRLSVEKRIADGSATQSGHVRTSDIARLMELFQSSLLKYWEFDPYEDENKDKENNKTVHRQSSDSSSTTRVDPESPPPKPKRRWGFRKAKEARPLSDDHSSEKGKEPKKPAKKMPVIFFDEAHKLPALIQSNDAMKCLLDSMLVLTKQDRLCHVIHATSDPFYQTWLRQLNVMQHCKVITIGDCTKAETQTFFRERVLPRVPERIRGELQFEDLYDAFGGKLAHWHDYITDYVNSNGRMDIKRSSHFLQAHALLNLHVIHSSQAPQAAPPGDETDPIRRPHSSTDAIHPGLGPAGFRIYSAISNPHGPPPSQEDRATAMTAGYYSADFNAMQLLKVMSRLSQPGVTYLPYFLLCREMGVRAVDGMVKGRILDLRWTDPVKANDDEDWVDISDRTPRAAGQSGTAIGTTEDHESDMAAISEGGAGFTQPEEEEEIEEVVGPKLVPTTSIMRFAMREVVEEYEDVQSVSEYASLSDVDEY